MLENLRRLAKRAGNYLEDFWLGISTVGTAPAEAPGHVHYATVSYSRTKIVFRRLNLTEDDTFVDVGCGKGRVVCMAARHSIREAVGIEYSPERAKIAQRNVANLRGRRATARILCEAAEDSDYSHATVVYFFNPFEPPLLDEVLKKIRGDRNAKPTRIAFVMESTGHREVFERHAWLACYGRFNDDDGHNVALYRSVSLALSQIGSHGVLGAGG